MSAIGPRTMASDERVDAFPTRPIEGEWPYLWIDATYLKVRQGGRIVSVAVTIVVGVNTDGRREVLGMAIGSSEARRSGLKRVDQDETRATIWMRANRRTRTAGRA